MYKFSELILLILYNIYLPEAVPSWSLWILWTREILGTFQGHEALGSVYQHLDLCMLAQLALLTPCSSSGLAFSTLRAVDRTDFDIFRVS